jgi:hypothetical protein
MDVYLIFNNISVISLYESNFVKIETDCLGRRQELTPYSMARCAGVLPFLSTMVGSAPTFNNLSITPGCFIKTAKCNGVWNTSIINQKGFGCSNMVFVNKNKNYQSRLQAIICLNINFKNIVRSWSKYVSSHISCMGCLMKENTVLSIKY